MPPITRTKRSAPAYSPSQASFSRRAASRKPRPRWLIWASSHSPIRPHSSSASSGVRLRGSRSVGAGSPGRSPSVPPRQSGPGWLNPPAAGTPPGSPPAVASGPPCPAATAARAGGEGQAQAQSDASVQQAERHALRLFLCNPGLREVLSVLELADPLHREAMGWLWCLQQRLAGRESTAAFAGSDPTRSCEVGIQCDGLRAAVIAAMPSMDPPLAQLLSPPAVLRGAGAGQAGGAAGAGADLHLGCVGAGGLMGEGESAPSEGGITRAPRSGCHIPRYVRSNTAYLQHRCIIHLSINCQNHVFFSPPPLAIAVQVSPWRCSGVRGAWRRPSPCRLPPSSLDS